MFVCDLTKVAEVKNEAGDVRTYCNPNAALELGYAVRVLGWNRIVIVFNKAYGNVPDDLPFDARGHRTSTYCCGAELNEKKKPTAACQSQISNATGNLRATLVDALKLISTEDPKCPAELETPDPEVIRRKRDIQELERVFYWINLPVMDGFIDRLGFSRLTRVGTSLFDMLTIEVESVRFHFCDVKLKNRILAFYNAWKKCFNYPGGMEIDSSNQEAVFYRCTNPEQAREQQEGSSYVAAQSAPLRSAFYSLIKYVREKYIEIDLNDCGREALKDYLSWQK